MAPAWERDDVVVLATARSRPPVVLNALSITDLSAAPRRKCRNHGIPVRRLSSTEMPWLRGSPDLQVQPLNARRLEVGAAQSILHAMWHNLS